jgi:excisionase family DNA binding protein
MSEQLATATINAKEAAHYLGVSYWLILDMAKKNLIPCIHAGDRVLFRKETIDSWMMDQEEQSIHRCEPTSYGKIRKVKS